MLRLAYSNPVWSDMDVPDFPDPGYSVCEPAHPFGFNGMEKDDEVSGEGNDYTAMFWEYDARLGRRWNNDPIVHSIESPYACFKNSPILLNDPQGNDPISGNNKGDRSMKKYERKFEKLKAQMKKQGLNPSNADIHAKMEELYNDKKWMWVRNEKAGDKSGSNHAHYFHAGDLYRSNNPDNPNNSDIQTTSTDKSSPMALQRTINFATPFFDGGSRLIGWVYPLNSDGTINISLSTTNLFMSYYISQGDNPDPNQVPWLQQESNLTPRIDLDPKNKPSVNLTIPINLSNGGYLYVYFDYNCTNNANGGSGDNLNGIKSDLVNVNFTAANSKPMLFQPREHEVLVKPSNPNPYRLNNNTINTLKTQRTPEGKGVR